MRRPRTQYAAALLALAAILSACAGAPARPQTPRDQEIPWQLNLPPGFRITLYAKGLEEVRKVAFSPDGTPYVTVMNRGTKNGGKVLALPDANHDGRADRVVVVADNLDRPDGITFYKNQLYASEPGTIWRMSDSNGDLVADAREPIVERMPTKGDHWARPFV